MRAFAFRMAPAAAVACLLMAFSVCPAAADPYRWCAQYGPDGGRNCGFITLQQCLDTISGVGGGCERNTFYTGPDEAPRAARRPLRKTKRPAIRR